MNPLTQIKNTQKISKDEIELGLSDKSSWHSRFKHSAYIFAGGLPLNLTEGDLLAIFAQYGEIVDLSLSRDRKTGKPKGFAFLAYEDQRSTVVAVDNLSGAKVSGRTLRVEHVDNYRRKRAEMEGEPDPGSGAEDTARPDPVRSRSEAEAPDASARQPPVPADEPWAAGSSVFSMLNAPLPPNLLRPAAVSGANSDKPKKSKKEKKEKKEKRRGLSPAPPSPLPRDSPDDEEGAYMGAQTSRGPSNQPVQDQRPTGRAESPPRRRRLRSPLPDRDARRPRRSRSREARRRSYSPAPRRVRDSRSPVRYRR
uniref:RRM domain-containing protein n=1 Tax=Auxenochlorella protothecoides TaxID=3075 RepID=A0A1D1ZWK2_AUXPR